MHELIEAVDGTHVNPKYLDWPRVAVIVALLIHLAYFIFWHVFLAFLFMGYAYERESSLGEPAWPTYAWGITQFAVAILFVLTLYFVVKKSNKCLVTASVACIGGYLLNQASVVFLLDRDLPFFDLGPQALFAWGLPIFAISLGYAARWILLRME